MAAMEDSASLKKRKLTQLDNLSFKHKLRSMANSSKNSTQKDKAANPVSTSQARNLALMPNIRPESLELTEHERTQSAPRSLISASKKYLGKIPRSRGISPGAVWKGDSNLSISGSSSRGSSPTCMQSAGVGLSEEKQKQKIEQAKTSRLYLIRRNGPCSFVVVADDVTVKHIVKIDEHPSCSCNKKFCVHLLFVYIRVLGVSENDSRIFLDKLRNYEIDSLISAFEKKLMTRKKSNSEKLHLRSPRNHLFKMERSKSHLNLSSIDQNGAQAKKGQGQDLGDIDQNRSSDSLNKKMSTLSSQSFTPNLGRQITLSQKSLEREPDCDETNDDSNQCCSICLLPMSKEENLLDCTNGCKNQLHQHCLQIWEKACRNRDEAFTCPLCRATMVSEQTRDDDENSGNSCSNISLASSSLSSPISEMENFHNDDHILHILQPHAEHLTHDVISALSSQDERLVPLSLQAALKKCHLLQQPNQHSVVLALLEFMLEKSNSFLEHSSNEILELFVLLKNNFDAGLFKTSEVESLINKLVDHLSRHPRTLDCIGAIVREATANHSKIHAFILKSVASQIGSEQSPEFTNCCLCIVLAISSNKHPTYIHQIWSYLLDGVITSISIKWKEFDRMSRRKVREILSHLCAFVCGDSEKAAKLMEAVKRSRNLSRFVEEKIQVERMTQKMITLQSTLETEESYTLKVKKERKQIVTHGKKNKGCIETSPRDSIDFSHFEEGIHWRKGDCVGRGGHSTCHVIKDCDSGRLLVVKQIPQTTATANTSSFLSVRCEEAEILRKLAHPHIVKVFGFNVSNGLLNIYQEWMPGGTVTSHIKQYGAFGEESLKRLLVQLVDAINYLHCQNVVHRDIKGDNILLDRWGLNLKLCDFGAAAILSCNCTEPMEFANQLVGTVCFMAPEVIRGENYGRSCDIWSFGCVVIQMSSGHMPWGASRDSNKAALMYKIGVSLDPPSLESVNPPEVRDLASRCLEIDPKKRPGAASLLCHPLFSVSF